MHGLPAFADPDLLVGPEHFSDAGVYRIAEGTAIVQTVDFFPPVVDDAFVYGQIAAANALSDVYAMGGRPKTALNIVCFPDDKLGMDILERILKGGADRVAAAGAVVVGGHSVRDVEIKYGLAVSGVVDPVHMMTNRGARSGDRLILTKRLGTGFITTAARAGRCPPDVLEAACSSMVSLNATASEAAVAAGAQAATDVTGFGLAGHALELARASAVTVHLRLSELPLLPGAQALADRGFHSRANPANRSFVAPSLRSAADEQHDRHAFLYDPQTSGGLLIAVAPAQADVLTHRCVDQGVAAVEVGYVTEREEVDLVIEG